MIVRKARREGIVQLDSRLTVLFSVLTLTEVTDPLHSSEAGQGPPFASS